VATTFSKEILIMSKSPLGEWGEAEHEAKLEMALRRQRKEKLFVNLLGVIIGAVSVFLIMHWFDWRLLVVIFLALFGNNLSQLK